MDALPRLAALSDAAIGVAYVVISALLTYLVWKAREDIPFNWMFLAFGLFIVACGGTHFMEVWTIWNPDYWLSGALKFLTAAVSVGTAVLLPGLIPKAIDLGKAHRVAEERRVRLEEAHGELQRLYQEVKSLDEAKTQFFANISHELRTPLMLILGPVRALRAAERTADARQKLEVIERNAATLLRHVNDLLAIARLDAGKMAAEYVPLDLAFLVKVAAAHFEVLAQEKRIAYSVAAPERLPAEADPAQIQRVLLNLLSNAFKFTPDGGTIRCSVRGEDGRAVLVVEDSGPGVKSELRRAIFERFRQAEGGTARPREGTGLGLSIAKEFVQLHGGAIEAVDSPLGGALFRVELPLKAPAVARVGTPAEDAETVRQILEELGSRAAAEDKVQGHLGNPLVLVVEDNRDMSRFICETLSPHFRVASAYDGREGLEKALSLRPDLVLMDIMMPTMSGDQMMAELRAQPGFEGVPLIFLTARADEEMRLRMLRQGASDYVAKPFSAEELLVRIGNHIRLWQTAESLMRANRDLESFAHVVSHDLKEPLRMVSSYTQLLVQRYKGKMGPEADQFVSFVVEGVGRMYRMIDDLLEYSRVRHQEPSFEGVESGAVLARALENLEKAMAESEAVVTHDPLPCVRADAGQLLRIFQNLVGNAIKFRGKEPPRIHVAARRVANAEVFSVRDNGIGIDPKDHERIFNIFQRLHTREQYPGNGIGLAICKGIVERHGGRIWVESGPGKGTTFFFTLPLAHPEA